MDLNYNLKKNLKLLTVMLLETDFVEYFQKQ